MLNLLSLYTQSCLQNSTLVTFSPAKQIIQRTILSANKAPELQQFIQISLKENLTMYSALNHTLPKIVDSKF